MLVLKSKANAGSKKPPKSLRVFPYLFVVGFPTSITNWSTHLWTGVCGGETACLSLSLCPVVWWPGSACLQASLSAGLPACLPACVVDCGSRGRAVSKPVFCPLFLWRPQGGNLEDGLPTCLPTCLPSDRYGGTLAWDPECMLALARRRSDIGWYDGML